MQQPARAAVWTGVMALTAALGACQQEEPLPQQGPAEHGGRAYAWAVPDARLMSDADETIVQQIRRELARDPAIGDLAIKVKSARGRVYLRGFVASSMQKARAAEIVGGIDGVTRVDNGLITRAPSGVADGPLAQARLYL